MHALLRDLFRKLDFDIDVAYNGKEAVQKATSTQYDIITMDVTMPVMDGITAVKEIMRINPTPILMVSALTTSDADVTIEALREGAVDYISKPSANNFEDSEVNREILLKIKSISSIPKDRLRTKKTQERFTPSIKTENKIESRPAVEHGNKVNKVVLVGSSTGGPGLIETLCKNIPHNYPYPICIVQHMPAAFTKSFASRLSSISSLPVHEVSDGMLFESGNIYIAKGGSHLHFVKEHSQRVSLKVYPKSDVKLFLPSVDEVFNSALTAFSGSQLLGVLLTGIGDDGAKGMLAIKNAGGMTIGESESSAQVYGMPRVAYEIGGVSKQLPFSDILREVQNFS